MSELSIFELEIAHLIVDSLRLEDVRAEKISAESPLFGEGLGLDSIDALELALAIGRTYGVQVRSQDVDGQRIFASLRALSQYIEQRRDAA